MSQEFTKTGCTAPLSEPRLVHVPVLRPEGFLSMAYWEWGDPAASRVVVCVHGLTRNGRDFDDLAQALAAQGTRVICPDVLGRGRSDCLSDPSGYAIPLYLADMATLLARLDVPEVDWIGTSMGGLIGLFLAILKGSPIRRLVLNDVGPFLPADALAGITRSLGDSPSFASPLEAEAHLRQRYASYGVQRDDVWHCMAVHGLWLDPADAARWVLAFDPAIAVPLQEQDVKDVVLWPVWAQLSCPTLVVRGAQSVLLSAETVETMVSTHPACEVLEVAGAGHAPMLTSDLEIKTISAWLAAKSQS